MRWFENRRLKCTYVTRTVPDRIDASIGRIPTSTASGDLVVAKVSRVGVHTHVEDRSGRMMRLYEGDLIVGACGNRPATDEGEAYTPVGPETHLLSSGGLIGTVASRHGTYSRPTELRLIGCLVENDRPLSTRRFARKPPPKAVPPVGTMAVVGSHMESGKTTTVAGLIRGWTRAGFAVGAGKVTGLGAGSDRWTYLDAGAATVLDHLDFGMPSTFGHPLEFLAETMLSIRSALVGEGARVVVLEFSDGLLQPETSGLIGRLVSVADAVIVAAVDVLSARGGVEMLRGLALPVRSISGLITSDPAASEEARRVTGLPVLGPEELAGGAALGLLSRRVPA